MILSSAARMFLFSGPWRKVPAVSFMLLSHSFSTLLSTWPATLLVCFSANDSTFSNPLTTEPLVYALPLILLLQGVLHHSKGVTLTFVLGALTICTTMVRFICLKVGTGQENLVCKIILPFLKTQTLICWSSDPLSMLEMALAIIVVSLPGLKPLVDRAPKHQTSSEIVEMKN